MWLKKRLNMLELFRKGAKVKYSPVEQVQRAIEVDIKQGTAKIEFIISVHRQNYKAVVITLAIVKCGLF